MMPFLIIQKSTQQEGVDHMSENIETLQRSTRVIPSPPEVKAQAHIQDYDTAYNCFDALRSAAMN